MLPADRGDGVPASVESSERVEEPVGAWDARNGVVLLHWVSLSPMAAVWWGTTDRSTKLHLHLASLDSAPSGEISGSDVFEVIDG